MSERLITLLTIGLLLVATSRLVVLTRTEIRRLQDDQRAQASIPALGSLHGIGVGGVRQAAPPPDRYRLLFVIRSTAIARDVEHWNAIRQAVAPRRPQIEWWGICDAGSSCDRFQGAAQFSIIGFLDPYEMRVMALADADDLALLYKGSSLRGRIRRATSPGATADDISRLIE